MRRLTSIFAIVFAALWCVLVFTIAANSAGPTIVVDVNSGKVLEHKDAFQRWYPASLTKLMTAYVVFRQVKAGKKSMQSPVTISVNAAKAPPSKMYFKAGSQLTLDNAMKIILVKSANDVSVAIAESVAGSHAQFVAMMNAEAARLGMTDTRFINANGLPGKGQRTTARDMALLGVALKREFPQHEHYFSLEAINTGKKTYTNYNILIGRFPGANGMKTGFICASGFNQVSSATRNGKTVVSVVLGAKDQEERAVESARLLHKGLTTPGLAKPVLYSMRPYGKNRSQLVNLRSVVCTKEARKARYGGRDVEGRMKLESAYIKPLRRKARAVRVGLSGRVPPGLASGKIPVPRSRPRNIASSAEPVASTQLKPAYNVPVPKARPRL
ncbi:D-alanyl-D-alanine carboxypeptidase family protein [Hoeflea sp. TYP-13]|uniref:D-alanyl-D-alanine carboxypeptidase family protein n=1 Tax=Hoeflea sp. TYP-13 TaxID=3230023 RepID=UPI0034C6CC25